MSVQIIQGDSREQLPLLAADSIDAVITDPPYALVSITKRRSGDGPPPREGVYRRSTAGFMGKAWDTGETAFDPAFWSEVLRVMKPGAHLIAFGGTRTYHRLVCAIEDAGFEIRDSLSWNFGSGFPKSHDPKKAAGEAVCRCSASDDQLRRVRDASHDGGGMGASNQTTDMLAAMQRGSARAGLVQARPQRSGGGQAKARHADGEEPGLEGRRDSQAAQGELQRRSLCAGAGVGEADGAGGWLHHGASSGDGANVRAVAGANGGGGSRGSQPVEQRAEQPEALSDERGPQARGAWPVCGECRKPMLPDGLGSALKPAMELICLGRKPLIGTIAANVLKHGTGALNIDACRVETEQGWQDYVRKTARPNSVGLEHVGDVMNRPAAPTVNPSDLGRWPANVIHDGSPEVLAGFPQSDGQQRAVGPQNGAKSSVNTYGDYGPREQFEPRADSGSAARFFYTPKADKADRCLSKHPTVKPIDLMAYLIKLVTPPGGTVLDPFAGSGSTGMAAMREGFNAILIEREAEYVRDIQRRLNHVHGHDTPLFADLASQC